MKTTRNKLIGERIKSARMQLGYSRREFAVNFHFSPATLQAWEDGKYAVPLKSISKYVKALNDAGLVTTVEWFTEGIGLPPHPKDAIFIDSTIKNTAEDLLPEKECIHKEISFFRKVNKNSIMVVIPDDTMKPFFEVGDYVGGNTIQGSAAEQYLGSFCIITLSSGETLIRKLKQGSKKDCYNLISTNLDSNAGNAFLTDCNIEQIAQIVWHRKMHHV